MANVTKCGPGLKHSTGFEEQSATSQEIATYLEQSATYLEHSATYLKQSATFPGQSETSEQSVTWDRAERKHGKLLEGFRHVT